MTWDFGKNHSSLNGKIENIENLQCDLIELIEMRSASRHHVREVITSDINLLTNKIESLKDDVPYAEISCMYHNGRRSQLVEENFVPTHGIVSLNLYQSYKTGMNH